jgi:dTDP-4-amino-4,6-dideoxygalactose transaminase
MMQNIPFNKPYHCNEEIVNINDAFLRNHVSGNGFYTKKCHHYFEENFQFNKCFLTTSCTDALEMCALLLNLQKGDEIIMPYFTFVSTALAFVRQGATIKFVDSRSDFPGMDETQIEKLISSRTKAIVVVHYAGIACNMDFIMELAERHNLVVIEDAAQCIDSYYNGKPLGSIGHLGCFSFHETKNIHCGEGGMLVVNDNSFVSRAEKLWEKGTNRAEYFRNQVNKYEWVDMGSSFLPSDILAAMLFAQLEKINTIQQRRVEIWDRYFRFFSQNEHQFEIEIPFLPAYATNNGHMFWIVLKDPSERERLIHYLDSCSIHAVFHYQSLHASQYYSSLISEPIILANAEKYSSQLLRLPLFYSLNDDEVDYICKTSKQFFSNK